MIPEEKTNNLSVNACRKILGKTALKMTDEEIKDLLDVFTVISDLAIDSYLEKMRREQKNEQ